MPELPELQALAEGLTAACAGRTITEARAVLPSTLKTATPPLHDLAGQTISGVTRRGKVMLIEVGPLTVAVHLMQGGRLGLVPRPPARPGRTVALTLDLDDGSQLRMKEFGTEHRASVHVVTTDAVPALPMIAGLGPEPIGLMPGEWRARLTTRNARLHTALRDGHRVAGIGRAYASDIMWAARLAPFAATTRLSDEEFVRLAKAADTVLSQALERARGRISTNLPDKEERVTAVHKHFGDPCLRCGRRLERVSFEGYELVYCPDCQTGGRVLADRRMSRLLR